MVKICLTGRSRPHARPSLRFFIERHSLFHFPHRIQFPNHAEYTNPQASLLVHLVRLHSSTGLPRSKQPPGDNRRIYDNKYGCSLDVTCLEHDRSLGGLSQPLDWRNARRFTSGCSSRPNSACLHVPIQTRNSRSLQTLTSLARYAVQHCSSTFVIIAVFVETSLSLYLGMS